MKKLFCLMLSLVLLLGACESTDNTASSDADNSSEAVSEAVSETVSEEPSEGDTSEPEAPVVFRAVVCSDTHVSTVCDNTAVNLADMLRSAYKYAESRSDYNIINAILVAGDLTNFGSKSEYNAWNSTVNLILNDHPETILVTVMGNHEYYGGGQETYKEMISPDLDKHIVVNGFHIIGLSTRGTDKYTSEQLDWLDAELKKAAEDNPEKPIFTFQHHHLQNTVYASKTWYTSASARFKEIYSKYPQVINFSGHSHAPINNPRSIWQDGFTMLGTGSLAYFEMEPDMTEKTVPEDAKYAAQFYIIEVDENNGVRIMPYNLLTDDFFKNPAGDDDSQLVYRIPKPSDPSTFLYTGRRAELASEPQFPSDAAVTADKITSHGARLTFPTALDSSCIYGYRAVCIAENGTRTEQSFYARYYTEPMLREQRIQLDGLESSTDYTVMLYPINVWYKTGKPLTVKFTTNREFSTSEYQSSNEVTYVGTFTDFESLKSLTRSKDSYAYGGSIGGDVFGGDRDSNASDGRVALSLAKNKGFGGSTALEVSFGGDEHINRGIYVFATEENRNTTAFPDFEYLRLWVDFTGVDFRKACFGLVTDDGTLYTADNMDYRNAPFYYLPDGEANWKQYRHGIDGCFGVEENASVRDFKGWLAFPVNMFASSENAFDGNRVSGIYMYWDLLDNSMLGKPFYLDEIHLVPDYTKFDNLTRSQAVLQAD